jgi:predicted nuclease of predicted toxin-antitoxin system
MKVRFQADNDLDQRIVVATLRLDSAIDFQTAPAAHLHNMPDDEVLAYASSEGRVLVSHDRKTMPDHFGHFLSIGETSPGLIIVSTKLPVGRAAEWLHLLWEATSAEEYVNSIYNLP